ncbi:S-adenosyl-L-methionine-dependent methyltransferase [Mycena rebaudengoi]|nr:S-adenosyl-L-methionine-dependent methyltransferase [Mycena rebaudengoi]
MTSKYDDTFLLKSVGDAYSSVARTGAAAECELATTVAQSFGYTVEQLESIPKESHMGLGCGNPTVTATLKQGETVLDLGSGGGIDIFLAASKIGPHGKAIGLDMSSDMIQRARNNAVKRGLYPPHVCFVECLLTEALPIKSNSVDCVLSNCVINLLPQSGKNHIFREIYRVLKPGGRLVLDDILAKQELPPYIRDDMKQYVACIGGAIRVEAYDVLLTAAGFKDSLFVDSLADLNIYMMATELEHTAPSCCAAGPGMSATSSPQKLDLDFNKWASSYQIYARKPDDSTESISDTPLARWWDAFPTPKVTSVARISPTDLVTMLKNGSSVTIIDVRGEDRVGGHIKGSHNIPAQTFHQQLTKVHDQFTDAGTLVFYCGGSVGRAPRCAGWYQDFLDANGISTTKVLILEGGMSRWMDEFAADKDVVEG